MTAAEKTRLLAERVMGLEVRQRECGNWQAKVYEDETKALYSWVWLGEPRSGFCRNWNPLTNLAHAGEVLEAMRKKGCKVQISIDADLCEVEFHGVPGLHGFCADPLLATAICHAALLAVGVLEEEL